MLGRADHVRTENKVASPRTSCNTSSVGSGQSASTSLSKAPSEWNELRASNLCQTPQPFSSYRNGRDRALRRSQADPTSVGECIAQLAANPPEGAVTVVSNSQIIDWAKKWREANPETKGAA